MLPNRKSAGLARVISRSRNSIYPAVSRNDNHCGYGVPPETQSRFFTASDVNIKTTMQEILEVRSAGHEQQRHWERGRRRTRQDQISLGLEIAGEIADLRIRTERRKLISSAGPVFELFERSIQPFDLMSRRHPLSSTRAVRFNQLRKANRPEGSCDVPASSRRQFSQSEIYFFFLTRRVFFAVFFTALFAFFAFLAFLAMLPS